MADKLGNQGDIAMDGPGLTAIRRRKRLGPLIARLHEFGEDRIGTDAIDKAGAQGAIGHPLQRRQHQRRRAGAPGEFSAGLI